jgi:hypothetical protein
MEFKQWMQNGRGTPESAKKLYKKKEVTDYSHKTID